MRSAMRRWSVIGAVGALVTGSAVLGAVHTASARDDSGVHEFFSSMFGGGGGGDQAEPAPAPAPRYEPVPSYTRPAQRSIRRSSYARLPAPRTSAERPLTVKLHRPVTTKAQLADAQARPGRVSIFQDKTLRRGDAVMTAKGIRIFAGSNSWPYQDRDFVALADARQLDKGLQKVLLDLDRMPHG